MLKAIALMQKAGGKIQVLDESVEIPSVCFSH